MLCWKDQELFTKQLTFLKTFKYSTTWSDKTVHLSTKNKRRRESDKRQFLLFEPSVTEIGAWFEASQSNCECGDSSFTQISSRVDIIILRLAFGDKEDDVWVASWGIRERAEYSAQSRSCLSGLLLRFGNSVAELSDLCDVPEHHPVGDSVLCLSVVDDGDVCAG